MKKKLGLIIFFYLIYIIILVSVSFFGNQYNVMNVIATMGFFLVLPVFLFHKNFYVKELIDRLRGYVFKRKLKNCGGRFRVGKNVNIMSPANISFGDNCDIADNAVIAPLVHHGGNNYPSQIIFGNNIHIGNSNRIASMTKVVIEDDVLFAAFVHISDHSHDYRDVGKSISKQGVYSKGPVIIRRGAWLSFGCHILAGVTVGECAVVAANSVVTKDVPAYSVVAGNPARVVKKYNFDLREWETLK